MKKSIKKLYILAAVCALVFFAGSVSAQFSGGIRAGVNFATEQYPGFNVGYATLGYGGVFGQYQTGPVAFQLGLNYSGEGTNLKVEGTDYINKYRETYFNVPFFIQGHLPGGGYVEVGAQYGFLSTSTYNFNNQGNVNTLPAYKSTDFSVGAGIGYEFTKPAVKGLGINLRFMQNVTAISPSGYGDIKGSVISAGLTYRF